MGESQYYCTWFDLEEKLEASLEKTLGEVDKNDVFAITETNPKVTGIAGSVIEQSVIGYPANSEQEPDLVIDGEETELKTTGLRISKKGEGLEAKEPMSITAVSLGSIDSEEFETSNFWHKLKRMLIVYYLYDSDITVKAADYSTFPIKGYQLHEFDDLEQETLKTDWTLVRDYVRNIHESTSDKLEREKLYPGLSSDLRKDLVLIDTAPKYPHPPRFRLKRSTVTSIAKKNFGESLQQLPKRFSSMAEIDAELHEIAQRYKGRTLGDIAREFGIKRITKGTIEKLVVAMFGGNAGHMRDIELFSRAGLKAKSITLTKKGKRTEDMKLFSIDFDEFHDPSIAFEDSPIYDYFAEGSLICIVLEEPSGAAPLSENVFLGFKRLSFDDEFIEAEVKTTYDEIKNLVYNYELVVLPELDKNGTPIINKNGVPKGAPNFPKSADHKVFVRGTGRDSSNKPERVNGLDMYRQQLWIRGDYMAMRLEEEDWI